MNRIPSEKEALAIQLLLSGHSTRSVARDVGINRNTAWTLGRSLRDVYGTILCPCGKPSGHKAWCGFMMSRLGVPWRSQLKDIGSFNIYIPTRPRYERPEISNEFATEIPLLVNRRHIRSLDAPVFDGLECGHTLFKSDQLTPLEILMLKEEQESEEYKERSKRIAEWNRWRHRKSSAFSIT